MALVPYSPTLAPAAPRWRLPLVVAACTLAVGYVFGLTQSPRGWLTIGLVPLLVALARARGNVVRVVAEWAVVATLTVLLATPFGPRPQPPAQFAHDGAEAAAGGVCPELVRGLAGAACRQVDQLIAKSKALSPIPTTTTTRGGRR
jgi:hypothetical protein